MSTIRQFEDIQAWQKARELTAALYTFLDTSEVKHHFALRDQVTRASVSIMANIAEGFGREGTKEFRHFLTIAKASALEVRSHLYVIQDLTRPSAELDRLFHLARETEALTAGFIRYLERTSMPGRKHLYEDPAPYSPPT